jgi:hypothetical protein
MDSLTNTVTSITSLPPAAVCFIFTYGVGLLLKKTPKFDTAIMPYLLILTSATAYTLTGDIGPGRNPYVNLFMSGCGIGVSAWLIHYYHNTIPLLNKIFPDSPETAAAKLALKNKPTTDV